MAPVDSIESRNILPSLAEEGLEALPLLQGFAFPVNIFIAWILNLAGRAIILGRGDAMIGRNRCGP